MKTNDEMREELAYYIRSAKKFYEDAQAKFIAEIQVNPISAVTWSAETMVKTQADHEVWMRIERELPSTIHARFSARTSKKSSTACGPSSVPTPPASSPTSSSGQKDRIMSNKNSSKKVSKKQTVKSTEPRPAKRKKIVSLAEYEAEAKAEMKSAASTVVDVGAGSKEPVKADQPANERKPSGLDAAAQILAEAGEPLNTTTMVARMLAKDLWKTDGKTPAATIYAAIIREISLKGANSRFRKVDRGRFELVK